jgi:hypothetical protein
MPGPEAALIHGSLRIDHDENAETGKSKLLALRDKKAVDHPPAIREPSCGCLLTGLRVGTASRSSVRPFFFKMKVRNTNNRVE